MKSNYIILSRGTHVDYRWNHPSSDAEALFSIGRDEEVPVIILRVSEQGSTADLLLGGIASEVRRDRTGAKIRDAIFFPALPEREVRALVVAFANNPEMLTQVLDKALSFDQSDNGWGESDSKEICNWIKNSIQNFTKSAKPWNPSLQTGEPYRDKDQAFAFVAKTFSEYALPSNPEANLCIFAKYLRMERRFEEITEQAILMRCDMISEKIVLPKKKCTKRFPSSTVLSVTGILLLILISIIIVLKMGLDSGTRPPIPHATDDDSSATESDSVPVQTLPPN
jgi:hypothetical protein